MTSYDVTTCPLPEFQEALAYCRDMQHIASPAELASRVIENHWADTWVGTRAPDAIIGIAAAAQLMTLLASPHTDGSDHIIRRARQLAECCDRLRRRADAKAAEAANFDDTMAAA